MSHPRPAIIALPDSPAQCIVLFYAMAVRYSNKRKLRGHTIRNATEIVERGEMTEVARSSEEVPFGIRAIERGWMVEGVWNSEASTPLQTPPSSKTSSPVLKARNTLKRHKKETSSSNVSGLDIPEPAVVPPNLREAGVGLEFNCLEYVGIRARNQAAGGLLDFEDGRAKEDHLADGPGPAVYHDRSATSTTYGPTPSRSRSQARPSWTSKGTLSLQVSTRPRPIRQINIWSELSGDPSQWNKLICTPADETFLPIHPDDSASQTSTTYGDVNSCAAHHLRTRCSSSVKGLPLAADKFKTMPLSEGLETLELMNAHRRSHAAETGQLIPRVRRKAGSGEFSGLGTSQSESGKDCSPARSVSWPMSFSDSFENTATPATLRYSSEVEDVPIRVLARSLPLPPLRNTGSSDEEVSKRVPHDRDTNRSDCTPLVDTKLGRRPNPASLCVRSRIKTSNSCPSSWTDRVQEQLEEVQPADPNEVESPITDNVLSHHNTTARKINSGFEVLPVGTVAMPTPVREWEDVNYALADTSDEVRVPRKLQKRDRSRSKGRRSSSEHERHRKENVKQG